MHTAQTGTVEDTAYRAAVAHRNDEIAGWLRTHLGQRITAVALGVSDPQRIGDYAAGRIRPSKTCEARMRLLYRAARTVADVYDAETARAFLVGANPQLGDRSPLLVLADDPPEQAAPQILAAVRSSM